MGESLGRGIQSLCDGVESSARSKGDSVSVGKVSRVSLSRPLTKVVAVGGIGSVAGIGVRGESLGRGIQSLGDGVEPSARSKGDSISVGNVGWVGLCLQGSKQTSQNHKLHPSADDSSFALKPDQE